MSRSKFMQMTNTIKNYLQVVPGLKLFVNNLLSQWMADKSEIVLRNEEVKMILNEQKVHRYAALFFFFFLRASLSYTRFIDWPDTKLSSYRKYKRSKMTFITDLVTLLSLSLCLNIRQDTYHV